MRNLILGSVLSLSVVACGGKGGDSCNANGSVVTSETTTVGISEVMDSGNKILVRKDEDERVLSESTKVVLKSGESYTFSSEDEDEDEDDVDSVVDLENLVVKQSDGTVVKIKPNDFKGDNWYSADMAEMISKASNEMVGKKEGNMKFCSIEKLSMDFKIDTASKSITTEYKSVISIQLDQDGVDYIKAVNGR